MKIVYTPRAEAQLAHQLDYGIRGFGKAVASRTVRRLRSYVRDTIGRFPRAARRHEANDAYVSWVPRTPFVVIYRIEPDAGIIRVVAVLHTAQDRSDPKLDSE